MIQIDCLDMPKCCYDCRFIDENGDYPFCTVLQENRGYSFDTRKKKFPNCPLKEVEPIKNDDLEDTLRILFNRCRAIGSASGALCMFCGLREKCDKYKSM